MACGTCCSENKSIANGNCDSVKITLPDVPEDIVLPDPPKIGVVTTEPISGTGVFDIYMRAGMNQLNSQYDAGRIKGADFATAYLAQVELMMNGANKFVIDKYKIELDAYDARVKDFLLPYEALKAMYEIALTEAQIKKAKHEADLICQQIAELKVNGASKRNLEAAQRDGACEQVTLYKAQAKGFQDKNRNDTFKTVMNAWAINAVEVDPDPNPVGALNDTSMDSIIGSARSQASV